MGRVLRASAVAIDGGSIRGELYDLGAYPGVFVPAGCEATIIGEVVELQPESAAEVIRTLDRYEGCGPGDPEPHQYHRARVSVAIAGRAEVEAWAYLLNELPRRGVRIEGGDFLASGGASARRVSNSTAG